MSTHRPESGVRVRAPGKINLYLGVGTAGDDGYHDVASVYQAVSLYEEVRATHADAFTMSVAGTVDVSGVPTDETNLALRAARAVAEAAGYDGAAHLEITKHVPVAGGMGGGSADAAAALVACDALWGTRLPAATLDALAADLGADVPFALHGGTAIGLGRGDELNPVLATGRFEWVLVTSEEGLSTPAVYRRLDERRDEAGARLAAPVSPMVPAPLLHALRAGDVDRVAGLSMNDLEEPALLLRPPLDDIIREALEAGAATAIVSGSGPTIAALAPDETTAIDLSISLSAAGHTVRRAHGPVSGARIVPE